VKFRTIFFLFNLVIFLSFAFIFLMPLPILGWAYAVGFWSQNWSIALVFVAVLLGLDWYFVAHWRLYGLLEKEDWPGLKNHLERVLAKKGRLGVAESRIYINACLIGQAPSKISELRALYLERKVRFLPHLALSLGLPLVLEGNSDAIEEFFRPYADDKRTGSDRPWIRWALGFGGLLGSRQDESRLELENLLKGKLEPLLELLALYLLDSLRAADVALAAEIDQKKAALARRYKEKEWANHIDKLKESVILVLFMGKLIQDAQTWLKSAASGEEK